MKNLKEYLLVNKLHEDEGKAILVRSEDLEKVICFYSSQDYLTLDQELSSTELLKVEKEFSIIIHNEEHEMFDRENDEIINYIFDKCNIKNKAHCALEIEIYDENKDCLYIDIKGHLSQFTFDDCDQIWSFERWNGNNWERIFIEEPSIDDVTFDKSEVNWLSLDKFDGSNFYFQANFHADITKLHYFWLVKKYSSFQGEFETIDILSSENEVRSFFEENDLDMDEEWEKLLF